MTTVILHGWRQNADLWANLVNKLGNDTFALDMPGFGSEPIINTDWNIPEYANWVSDKISKYKDVILVGHSFGGRVAVEIASQKPNNLRGIILSGAPCVNRPTLLTKIKIKTYKLLKLLIPKKHRKIFYTGDLKESKELEKIFRNVVQYDQTKQLQKIVTPTLLIWGENDREVPLRIAHEINNLIKDSELKIIDNAGHNSFLDKSGLFYGYVKNFISHI